MRRRGMGRERAHFTLLKSSRAWPEAETAQFRGRQGTRKGGGGWEGDTEDISLAVPQPPTWE